MRTRVLWSSALAVAAMIVTGCSEGERPVGGEGTPSSITQKANLSNPLNVVGNSKGKPQVADRRPAASRPLGR
jgi:hypothetical protein